MIVLMHLDNLINTNFNQLYMKKVYCLAALCLSLVTGFSQTQKPATTTPVVYGLPISIGQAEKVIAAAIQEATKNGWTVAIAIVDTGGNLVAFERMDNTQIGSVDVAMGKAKTANNFKRPTKVFEDVVAAGGVGLRILALPGVVAVEGGEPILFQGKIIGGIGVSGMQATQDDQVAKAGLSALN
jgi:glc operon protein GlcG